MNLRVDQRDALARAYLDVLAKRKKGFGALRHPHLPDDDVGGDPVEALIDDPPQSSRPQGAAVHAEVAAIAILVARAIEGVSGLTKALRLGHPVVVVASPEANFVDTIGDVLEQCAFGRDVEVQDVETFKPRERRSALLIAADAAPASKTADRDNRAAVLALHHGFPIVGVAADPARHLPRDLLRCAEHHLTLGRLDASALALTLEAVTGSTPTVVVGDDLLRRIAVKDLPLAIRPGDGADECIARLEALSTPASHTVDPGPSLEDLPGYSSVRTWALDFVKSIEDYKAGSRSWGETDNKAAPDCWSSRGRQNAAYVRHRPFGRRSVDRRVAVDVEFRYLFICDAPTHLENVLGCPSTPGLCGRN